MALAIKPGETAIVPAITFLATANAIRYVGGDVVFSDVDPDTGLMRPSDLEAALTRAGERCRAVLPVHIAGQCEDIAAIRGLAEKHGLRVIEDASHAIGTHWRGEPVGNCRYSDLTVFSFHPVKTIAAGEGGAVTTNDASLHDAVVRLRSHGIERNPARISDRTLGFDSEGNINPWYYEMSEIGFNYRLSDIHAALGASQMRRLTEFTEARAALTAEYDRLLAGLFPLVKPLRRTPDCMPSWHLYVGLLDFEAIGKSRATVMREMHGHGIGTQVHYMPLPWHPYYRARESGTVYPGAEAYYRRALTLPLFPAMTTADVSRVVTALRETLSR